MEASETKAMSDTQELLESPKWLDRSFVERCLQNYYSNKQLRIINLEIKPGTAKGENYASYIYRVNVVYLDGGNEAISKSIQVSKLLKCLRE